MANPNVISREADPKVVLAPQPLIPVGVPPAHSLHTRLRDWFAGYDELESKGKGMPDEQYSALVEEYTATLEPLLRTPATDAREAAAKYVAESRDGLMDISEETVAELRRFSEIFGPLDDAARREVQTLAMSEEDRRLSELDDLFNRWVEIHLIGEAEATTNADIQRNTDELARIAERIAQVPAHNPREGLIKFCV